MPFMSNIFKCDFKKIFLKISRIVFFILLILASKNSFSSTCVSLLSLDNSIIHVNFSTTSLRGRLHDHDDLDNSLDIYDGNSNLEELINASESYVSSKSFNSKDFLDIEEIRRNLKLVVKSRFTRDHILEFLELISPTEKQIFIDEFEKHLKLDQSDLRDRFILYMIHDWSTEPPVLVASEIGLNRVNRFIFRKGIILSGFRYTSQSLGSLEDNLFTSLHILNTRKVLTEAFKKNILEAYLRVMALRSYNLPLETWGLDHDTGDIKLRLTQIELDLLIFFKYIGFTNKKDVSYLIREAISSPDVLQAIYDLIYSTLMFYNSVSALNSDLMIWSRLPVDLRIWTPNRVKSSFNNFSMYKLKGADIHTSHFVKAVKEILHRLIFSVKNKENGQEFEGKDEFYFKTFKNLQIAAIHSQNKELFDRMFLDLRESAVLSLITSIDPELLKNVSKMSSSLIDEGHNDSLATFQQRVMDDYDTYIKLSIGFKSLINQQEPDQDWLDSYYELIKFSL